MTYNKIHNQFRIGLGLWFNVVYGHKDHPNGWTCLSNIPEINLQKLDAQFKDEAVSIVWDMIVDGLYIGWDHEAVISSMPKKLPRIRAGRNGRIKLNRNLRELPGKITMANRSEIQLPAAGHVNSGKDFRDAVAGLPACYQNDFYK